MPGHILISPAGGAGHFARHSKHRSPRGPSFCSCKRKQNRVKGNRASPLTIPLDRLVVLDTNIVFPSIIGKNNFVLRTDALQRQPRAHLPPPPCGARKNLRAARLLDFSTAAGEGDSIYNLYIKMRRRHLESVSAAPYESTFQHLLKSPIRIQPQLKR